jgi:shikimate kinase
MSRTVVLVGFSTSGKSTLRRELRTTYGDTFEFIDTDVELGRPYGGHVRDMYLALRQGTDTSPALDFVQRTERDILNSIAPGEKPLLVVTGPFVPLRELEWSSFVSRVNPIIYYLRLSPDEAYEGLLDRRSRGSDEIKAVDGYGCWDEGSMTYFNATTGKWDDLPEAFARPNMQRLMAANVAVYQRFASAERTYDVRRLTPEQRQMLLTAVARDLGLG